MTAPQPKVLRYNERTISLRRERDELVSALDLALRAMRDATASYGGAYIPQLPDTLREATNAARAALAKVTA